MTSAAMLALWLLGHVSDEIIISNTASRIIAPAILAHAAGARVFWVEADTLLLVDLDREGNRVRDPVTIAQHAEGFAVADNGVDTLVAWNADDSTVVAALVDREGRIAAQFPVAAGKDISVTGAACIASECAIAWSFPRFGIHFADAGFVARFSPSGTPIGTPIVMPANTHQPTLVAGDRDYLVILKSYDVGRPVYGAMRLTGGELRDPVGFGGRTVAAHGAWNGREWLVASVPMGPYSSIDLRLTRITRDGEACVVAEYRFGSLRHAMDLTWNGGAWIAAFITNSMLAAGEVPGEPAIHVTPVAIVRDDFRVAAVSSARDGRTWFVYRNGTRVFVRVLG